MPLPGPIRIAAALLAASCIATSAFAGASDFVGSTEISVLAGSLTLDTVFDPADEEPPLSFFIPVIEMDGGFIWGVRLGHRFTRHFEGELSLGYGSGEVSVADSAGVMRRFTGLSTVVYHVSGLVYLPYFGDAFEPYAAAGFGGTSYRPSSRARLDRTSAITGNVGAGARFYLNDKLAIRGDARLYALRFDRNDFLRLYPNFAPQTKAETLTHVELSLGVTLRFFDTDLF
jgi:hypothetical protein